LKTVTIIIQKSQNRNACLNKPLMPLSRPRGDKYWEISANHSPKIDDFDFDRENRLLSEALSKETHLRERAESACQELQKRLQRLSDSEKSLRSRLEHFSHETHVENKLEIIRLDHLVAQLSAQIETQEGLLRDTENREAEYEGMTLDNMDKLQAEWIKVLSENHARQKESQARIEELEARLRHFEDAAPAESASMTRQLNEVREQCVRLQEELRRAHQAADSWRTKYESAEKARRDAERRAGAGHDAQEVLLLLRNPSAATGIDHIASHCLGLSCQVFVKILPSAICRAHPRTASFAGGLQRCRCCYSTEAFSCSASLFLLPPDFSDRGHSRSCTPIHRPIFLSTNPSLRLPKHPPHHHPSSREEHLHGQPRIAPLAPKRQQDRPSKDHTTANISITTTTIIAIIVI
jgi:hypothetical protein